MTDVASVLIGDPNDNDSRTPHLRQGVVTQASPLLVRVGAAATATACRALSSYVPANGDSVAVLVIAGDRLVLGITGQSGGADGSGRFVRTTGDSMSGNLSFTGGAAERIRSNASDYMAWWNGATRIGYLQGHANGLTLNADIGEVQIGGATLNFGTNSYSGYRGVNWGGNYLIMSNGTDSFVSTPSSTGTVNVRGGINNAYQLQILANGNHVLVGNLALSGYNITGIGTVRAVAYAFNSTDTDTYIDNPSDGAMRLIVNGGVPFEISAPNAACSVNASQGYSNGLRLYSITNGDHAIRYRGDIDGVEILGHGDVRVALTATGYYFDFSNNGNAYASNGVWANASSVKLKENIDDLSAERAVRTVRGLRPVTFDWRDGRSIDQVGFIAEWTHDVAPYACAPEIDGQTPAAIDYGRLTPALTRVMQYVLDRLDRLEQKETS